MGAVTQAMAARVRRETITFSGDGPGKGTSKSEGTGRPPVLIVFAGPNGSGKTTMANVMLQHGWLDGCGHMNPDNIARDLFGDWNDSGAVLQAARYAAKARRACGVRISNHCTIGVE